MVVVVVGDGVVVVVVVELVLVVVVVGPQLFPQIINAGVSINPRAAYASISSCDNCWIHNVVPCCVGSTSIE